VCLKKDNPAVILEKKKLFSETLKQTLAFSLVCTLFYFILFSWFFILLRQKF